MTSWRMNIEGEDAHVSYSLSGKPQIRKTMLPGEGPVVTEEQVTTGEARDIIRENTYSLDELPGHFWDLVQRVKELEEAVRELVRRSNL